MLRGCVRHILCPIDFSVESDTALDCTEFLAGKFTAKVTVIHAERFEVPLEFTSAQVDGLVTEMNKLKKEAVKHLRSYAEARCPSLVADYRVIENSPVEAILSQAEANDVDLIVMGTTGKSGMRRFTMGSVAESVTRQAKVPVLTIRDKSWSSVFQPKVERMLVPINYTEHAMDALENAACLAQTLGASLLVTHIVESGDYDEEAARQRICQWVPDPIQGRCQYETVVRQGNAAEQIVQIAAEERADMIVIAAVHRPFLETTIIGTTSERVMRHAGCPVMVVPSGR